MENLVILKWDSEWDHFFTISQHKNQVEKNKHRIFKNVMKKKSHLSLTKRVQVGESSSLVLTELTCVISGQEKLR